MIKRSNFAVSSNSGRKSRQSITRPWFNTECQKMQQQYRRDKNIRRRVSDIENLRALNDTSKAYKKCLNKHFSKFKIEFIKKHHGLKTQILKHTGQC